MNIYFELQLLTEVVLAGILGGCIGFERERSDKPAGLRTHLLVAAGAAFLLGLAESLILHFEQTSNQSILQADPIRIVEAIITGISFLGAGTIFRHSDTDHIEGLTTAASILLCAAIGICVSLNHFLAAFGVTVFVLLTLYLSRFSQA